MTKNAPLIGITMYPSDDMDRVSLPAQYAEAVRRAGGLPLLIQLGEQRIDQLMDLLDGVVLSGGGDVNPIHYTDPATVSEDVYGVNPARDAFEFELVRRAVTDDLPLFCICRGIQVLNVALGGSLIPHIPDAVPNAISHRQLPNYPTPHTVQLQADSRLAAVTGATEVRTASWHHQALDRVADGLQVVGRASDGVIEAVEMVDKPHVMAVQWHPEITAAEDETQQRLFDALVSQARG